MTSPPQPKKPKRLAGLTELTGRDGGISSEELRAACDSCLTEIRGLSAALTTQALALVPIQVGLVAGFAVALRKGDPGDFFEVLALIVLTLAVMSSVFALIRVHDRTRWEKTDNELEAFVAKEAERVAAKGTWSQVGVGATLCAAFVVVLCNIVVFTG